MGARVVDSAEFNTLVTDEPLVLVDFFAVWCGPCKVLGPVLDQLADAELKGRCEVVKVDVDQHPDLARQHSVMSVPTVLLFKDGQPVARMVGNTSKQKLLAEVDKHG